MATETKTIDAKVVKSRLEQEEERTKEMLTINPNDPKLIIPLQKIPYPPTDKMFKIYFKRDPQGNRHSKVYRHIRDVYMAKMRKGSVRIHAVENDDGKMVTFDDLHKAVKQQNKQPNRKLSVDEEIERDMENLN